MEFAWFPPLRRSGTTREPTTHDAVRVARRQLRQEREPVDARVPRRGAGEKVLVLSVGGEDPVGERVEREADHGRARAVHEEEVAEPAGLHLEAREGLGRARRET